MVRYKSLDDSKDTPKISMLLDIQHFYGEHEGRLGPVVITLCVALGPILLYVYFSLFKYIPIWLFIPFEIIWAIRWVMIIIGREKYRLAMFRRQLYDEYTSTSQLLNIRTIHNDGCVEYINGNIAYFITAYNGTVNNDIQHTKDVRKFLTSVVGDFDFDIYIHNITSTESLSAYYSKISNFDKNESATNFIKIIDYNKELIQNNSMLQQMVFVIKGRRSDWKDIRVNIDNTLRSRATKCFKFCKLCTSSAEINAIIDRNIDSTIDINTLLRRKYKTDEFYQSRVIDFDVTPDDIIVQGQSPTLDLLPKPRSRTFHTAYKETTD